MRQEILLRGRVRGHLVDQYLAALCATRAPVGTDAKTVAFIQKLRLLVLARSMDALLSDQAIHESSLQGAAIAIRMACDTSTDTRLPLLTEIAGDETEFTDYCQDLGLRCDRALGQSKWKDNDRSILRAIRTISSGGPWKPKLTRAELSHNGTASNWSVSIWRISNLQYLGLVNLVTSDASARIQTVDRKRSD